MSAVNRALIGAVAWVIFVIARVSDLRGAAWIHALLVFAVLVLVPLALELFWDREEAATTARWFGRIEMAQLPAGLLLAVAYAMAPGALAVAAALPWVGVTGAMAVVGFWRLRRERLRREFDGLCADTALIFTAVGGAWVLADRSGFRPLGFDPVAVSLTAVHFHYAGLLLPLFAGLVQRELFFLRLASRAAVGVMLGVPAVACGITVTQLGGGMSVEAAAGCGLALAGMAVAILHVRIALDAKRDRATRVLLGIAGGSLFFGMVLAALYALRTSAALASWPGIPQMGMIHGTVNAIGFGLCGVLGWRKMADMQGAPRAGQRLSRTDAVER